MSPAEITLVWLGLLVGVPLVVVIAATVYSEHSSIRRDRVHQLHVKHVYLRELSRIDAARAEALRLKHDPSFTDRFPLPKRPKSRPPGRRR